MGPVQVFSPRSLDPGAVFAGNLMGAGRTWWASGEAPDRLAIRPGLIPPTGAARMVVEGELDGEPFSATFPEEAVGRLLSRLDPSLVGEGRAPADLALLLEHALTGPLDVIERISARRIALLRARPSVDGADPEDSYGFEASWSGIGPYPVAVAGGLSVNNALLALARACPPDWSRLAGMSLTGSLRFASATLSLDEVRALNVGDAIIPDGEISTRSQAVLVIGEHAAVAGHIANGRFTLRTAMIARATAEFGDFLMNDQANSLSASDHGSLARLSDLPVKLVFEIGRIEATLAELANAGSGHVFVLPAPVESGCTILAGGTVIGRGEIVEVAGQFGVRVTQFSPR